MLKSALGIKLGLYIPSLLEERGELEWQLERPQTENLLAGKSLRERDHEEDPRGFRFLLSLDSGVHSV